MNPPADKASVIEDVMDIFYAPSKVFKRREKSGFGMYLLIVWVIMAGLTFANRSLNMQIAEAQIDKGIAKAVAKQPQAASQIEAMKPIQLKIGAVVQYLAAPIWIFAVALLLWVTGMVTQTKVSYGQAALIVSLALIPRQLATLLTTFQIVLTDTSNITAPAAISFSPARFIAADAMSPKLIGLLTSLDVFRIWSAFVEAVGISVLAKVPMQKAIITSVIVFALFSALAALGAQ
ncbi:MAG TPA: YIP1 family protein [Gemmatimonadaceae bacterium]